MKKRGFLISDRKGISVIIGYILLISMAIMLSIIVYQWVKTYVPQGSIECSDGVSIFVQNYNYDCSAKTLDLTLKNNGLFDIAGYFIHGTTAQIQELATKDLSQYNTEITKRGAGSVNYWQGISDINPKSAGETLSDSFDLTSVGQIFSIEIIPLRYETIRNRNMPVSCTDAKIKETLRCSTCNNNDVKEAGELCDGIDLGGQTCGSLGYAEGTGLSCTFGCAFDTSGCTSLTQCNDGVDNDDPEDTLIDLLDPGCSSASDNSETDGAVCENGVLDTGEQCDDNNVISGDGCSSSCQIETSTGWSCDNDPMPSVCRKDVFVYLFSATNPLSDGWTSSCGVSSCGGSASNEIYTINTPNPCNADSSCGDYYMVTERDWAATKSISTAGYKDLTLSYYRRSQDTESVDRIVTEWRIGNSGSWTEIERINPVSTWNKNTYTFPSTANDKSEIQIRFWLNGQNNHKALWDSIKITAAKL